MNLSAPPLAADRAHAWDDWSDVLAWQPALWRSGTLYVFPRPVPRIRIRETWDAARFKVPLQDGETWTGLSRNGVEIVLEGQLLAPNPHHLWTLLDQLRNALHCSADDKAWLFLAHEPAAALYRHLRGCTTQRFDYTLSDPLALAYSAVLHADDPTLYSTGPA